MKVLRPVLIGAVLVMGLSNVRMAAAQQNVPPDSGASSHIGENVIPLNNAGTGGLVFSITSDCPGACGVLGGWGADVWKLTLLAAADVTIQVQDCCVVGDAYEILIDCDVAGPAGVDPDHDNDCSIFHSVPNLNAQGTTVSLPAGAYAIRVHDDGGQCTAGCPAGFSVDIAVNPAAGAPAPMCIARVDGLGPAVGTQLSCPISHLAPTVSHSGILIIAGVLALVGIMALQRRRKAHAGSV